MTTSFPFCTDYVEDARQPPNYLLTGAKSLTMHLKSWTQRKDVSQVRVQGRWLLGNSWATVTVHTNIWEMGHKLIYRL